MDKVKTLLPLAREQVENFKEKGKDGSSDLKQEVVTISSENEEQCCPGEPVQIWLQVDGQHLLHSDCDILQEGRCLNDKHINYAQKLLKLQFSCLEGLNLTLYQNKEQKSKKKKGYKLSTARREIIGWWPQTLPVKQMR